MITPWDELVAAGLIRELVDLAPLTTYKLGGPAHLYSEPETIEHLSGLALAFQRSPVPVLVLGRGSNLVVSDQGFPGLVVRLGRSFAGIETTDEVVTVGGLASLPQVARSATSAGRRRLEFMIGIPGTAGGGVRQNAGCFGSEIDDVLVERRGVRSRHRHALDLRSFSARFLLPAFERRTHPGGGQCSLCHRGWRPRRRA